MERVIYKKNPLIEAILQVRFPTILTINSNDPVDFQEAIRKDYPIYQLGIEREQELAFIAKEDSFFPSLQEKSQHKNHAFVSSDGKYKVNLTSSFVSMSTVNYTRWEEFYAKFKLVLANFVDVYHPAFYERIGLRYIDAFSREKLNITDKSWKELIQSPWIGPLSNVNEGDIINLGIDTEYILDNNKSRIKVHTGLGVLNNAEKVFIIDSDFIHPLTVALEEYEAIVEYLHENSGKFIRSVITSTLHEAMEPGELK